MKITVIGSVATIASEKIKLADLSSDVTINNEKGEPLYTVRKGTTWNASTASFNNADANGNAIFQLNMEGKTPDKVAECLTRDSAIYNTFATFEDQVANKIAADKAAKEAFAASITIA